MDAEAAAGEAAGDAHQAHEGVQGLADLAAVVRAHASRGQQRHHRVRQAAARGPRPGEPRVRGLLGEPHALRTL